MRQNRITLISNLSEPHIDPMVLEGGLNEKKVESILIKKELPRILRAYNQKSLRDPKITWVVSPCKCAMMVRVEYFLKRYTRSPLNSVDTVTVIYWIWEQKVTNLRTFDQKKRSKLP